VSIIISLKDIDEAVEGLNYRSDTTLKYKLIHAVRNCYTDKSSVQALKAIDTEELVKSIWETGDNAELVKNKKKNFSSLKSSINTDLKKLYAGGKNPQGIIINQGNVFDISDEAKNKALASISDVLREKGIDTGSRMAEILAAVSDILSGAVSLANREGMQEEISRLRNLIGGLEKEPADDGVVAERYPNRAYADICHILKDKEIDAATRMNGVRERVKGILSAAISSVGAELDAADADQIQNLFSDPAWETGLAITTKSSMQVSGTETVAEAPDKVSLSAEPRGTAADTDGFSEYGGKKRSGSSGGNEVAMIAGILQEEGLDAVGKAGKIKAAIDDMLEDAIASVSTRLNADKTDRIRNIFWSFAQSRESLLEDGQQSEHSAVPTIGEIAEAGDRKIVEIVEEVVEDEIPAATDETIAATGAGEYLPAEELEDVPLEPAPAATGDALPADEIVEIIEGMSGDVFSTAAADGEIPQTDDAALGAAGADLAGSPATAAEETATPGIATEAAIKTGTGEITAADSADYEEVIEAYDFRAETAETPPQDESSAMSPEPASGEAIAAGTGANEEIAEVVQEVAEDEITEPLPGDSALVDEAIADAAEALEEIDVGEEIVEELPVADAGDRAAAGAGGTYVDGEMQDKAEFLNKLAEAAKALERMGPDLSSSIYSEEEIKEKAKLLSDEFEHYLSVREKFYNQHILIKGGNYLTGGTNRGEDEFPEQIVNLRDFYIGKFPITNALFEIFVEKTGYITTAEKYGFGIVYTPRLQKVKNALTGRESCIWNRLIQHRKIPGACWHHPSGPQSSLHIKRTHPVVQVSLEDACAFAAWIGKRIPTEAEWEAAARTSRSYIYPWGNTWRENACNLGKSQFGDTTPVDSYLEFANDYGVADTLGNILEWTLDTWEECKPGEERRDRYVVKGASWIHDAPVSLTDRQPAYKNIASNILGFRCIAI
jgi:formylglycine-generating enzyme required for sulfatase activity